MLNVNKMSLTTRLSRKFFNSQLPAVSLRRISPFCDLLDQLPNEKLAMSALGTNLTYDLENKYTSSTMGQ